MDIDATYQHPSYGTLRFSRFSGKSDFFCVEPTLDGGITIEIHQAKVDRHLNRDWVHQEEMIIRARMSSYQFAEAITNLNRGEGVPITLEYVHGMNVDPYQAMPHERKKFDGEIKSTVQSVSDKVDALKQELNALQQKGKAGKKELDTLAVKLASVERVFSDSMPFIESSFQEILDKQTHKAKVEFSAWLDNQVHKHGLESLGITPQLPECR